MMPTEQRCPECGNLFIGSDAIGDSCPNCEPQFIDPGLFDKFLTMGNIEFVKKYGGFLKPKGGG